jgi:hypothetical protein
MSVSTKRKSKKSSAPKEEFIVNDGVHRFPEAASIGDTVRQGDIYITLLDGRPDQCSPVKKPSNQLAPGNTQGSRHCIDKMENVNVFSLKYPSVYDGPVLEVKSETTITHSEHGDWALPSGCYAVSYQRTEDREGRQRRVQD